MEMNSLPFFKGNFQWKLTSKMCLFNIVQMKKNQYALKNIQFNYFPWGKSLPLSVKTIAGKTTLVKLLCGLYYPTCGMAWEGQWKVC